MHFVKRQRKIIHHLKGIQNVNSELKNEHNQLM